MVLRMILFPLSFRRTVIDLPCEGESASSASSASCAVPAEQAQCVFQGAGQSRSAPAIGPHKPLDGATVIDARRVSRDSQVSANRPATGSLSSTASAANARAASAGFVSRCVMASRYRSRHEAFAVSGQGDAAETGARKPRSSSFPTGRRRSGAMRSVAPGPTQIAEPVILFACSSRAAAFTVSPCAV